MPFETYYRFGGLKEQDRPLHVAIIKTLLRNPASTIGQLSELMHDVGKVYDLERVGILERGRHVPGTQRVFYRIPVHLVKEAGEFVGKPRK